MVKAILAGQDEADEKLESDLQVARGKLEQIGNVLEQRSEEKEGDAV